VQLPNPIAGMRRRSDTVADVSKINARKSQLGKDFRVQTDGAIDIGERNSLLSRRGTHTVGYGIVMKRRHFLRHQALRRPIFSCNAGVKVFFFSLELMPVRDSEVLGKPRMYEYLVRW
jgi:hypothetical protein